MTMITVSTTDRAARGRHRRRPASSKFEPDGLVFAKPVTVTFALRTRRTRGVLVEFDAGGFDAIGGAVTVVDRRRGPRTSRRASSARWRAPRRTCGPGGLELRRGRDRAVRRQRAHEQRRPRRQGGTPSIRAQQGRRQSPGNTRHRRAARPLRVASGPIDRIGRTAPIAPSTSRARAWPCAARATAVKFTCVTCGRARRTARARGRDVRAGRHDVQMGSPIPAAATRATPTRRPRQGRLAATSRLDGGDPDPGSAGRATSALSTEPACCTAAPTVAYHCGSRAPATRARAGRRRQRRGERWQGDADGGAPAPTPDGGPGTGPKPDRSGRHRPDRAGERAAATTPGPSLRPGRPAARLGGCGFGSAGGGCMKCECAADGHSCAAPARAGDTDAGAPAPREAGPPPPPLTECFPARRARRTGWAAARRLARRRAA